MLQGTGITLVAGATIAAALLAIGLGLGHRLSLRRRKPQEDESMGGRDRERILHLLQEPVALLPDGPELFRLP